MVSNFLLMIINIYSINYDKQEHLKFEISIFIYVIFSILTYYIFLPWFDQNNNIIDFYDCLFGLFFLLFLWMTNDKIINKMNFTITYCLTTFICFLLVFKHITFIEKLKYYKIKIYIENNTYNYDSKLNSFSSDCSTCVDDFESGKKLSF